MVIWSGLGILVPVIGFACLVGTEYLTEAVLEDDQYYQSHAWPKLVALVVSGAIVWILGRRLNSKGPHPSNRHTFFFIPVGYWAPLLIALGAAFFVFEQMNDDTESAALIAAKIALKKGGSPHDVLEDHNGLTRMHVAARDGHDRVLGYLISKGGYVDIEDSSGQGWPRNKSPLHWVSTGEVVDILLAAGADREFPGPLGQTPLASVALRNRRAAVVRLLEQGADIHARDTTFGNTVLMWACMGLAVVDLDDPPFNDLDQRLAIVELLVGQGADVNAQSNDGETALHTAAKYDARFVQHLLELGADACVRDNSGKTPLDWATELEQEECVRLLKVCADTTE